MRRNGRWGEWGLRYISILLIDIKLVGADLFLILTVILK